MSDHVHYKVRDAITYPFPNFNGAAVEVWEWFSNYVPNFTGLVIIYPNWDHSLIILVERAAGAPLE